MYSAIHELPSQVRNALDEKDQRAWMEAYNSYDPKTEAESKKAYRQAWHDCAKLPSSFSFSIKASMDQIDKDREIVSLPTIKANLDAYIDRGGPVQFNHSNYLVGVVYDWNPINVNGIDGVEVFGNLYGGDDGIYDKTRKSFIDGTNSMSVAGEANGGKYECDERGCYIRRNVTELMEISICKVPANKGCTLNWYHEGKKAIAKSDDDFHLSVDEYTIHRSYLECPTLGLKKSLEEIGYAAHATAFGVMIHMDKSEYDRTLPLMKSHGLVSIWSNDYALVNDGDYLIETAFKDGLKKGYVDSNGIIQKSITKEQFVELMDKDVLCCDERGFCIARPRRS